MSSNGNEYHELPLARQPRSIGQQAQIEVEKSSRKMTLMFGERQVVFIRSDGLRSRIVRENSKKNEKELEEAKKKQERDTQRSQTLDEVIDCVARGSSEPTSSTNSAESSSSSISSDSYSSECSGNPKAETTSLSTHDIPISSTESSSSPDESGESNRKRPIVTGNRIHHPPRPFHGESTMVPHKKRWTYQTACNINAANQSNDSQMYYIPNPFYPMPRDRRNEISTAERMNYAAQRIDNRKFRGQVEAGNEIASKANERVSCEKCGMYYFLESKQLEEKIWYLPPKKEEDLPIVLFDCPVCKVRTRVCS
ncbi:hypothetical protein CAEBREN_12094 [Caenorhabditis brenneri]|uniref:Uncharacterized protein n=1 Tax=Caenorhabditis brenneri TaxID=135651 RepID=G0MEJ8_CAEBE|nr:hypothetical protein CAEBREN_12094 [Caenorhabditis brenneri]